LKKKISYARPRLITAEDRRYRDYVAGFKLQRSNYRPIHLPRQRDLFGDQAESALRKWLAEQFTLTDQRILEYEERQGRRAVIKYRELDALILEDKRTAWVFEIKASRAASSVGRAVGQLQETRTILHLLYPLVHCTILLVNTGIPTAEEVAMLMAGPEPPTRAPSTLAGTLEARSYIKLLTALKERSLDGENIDLVCFNAEDIIALVGAENLALDWEADDELDEESSPAPDNSPAYSTAPDETDPPDENPFAIALRRAGLEQE